MTCKHANKYPASIKPSLIYLQPPKSKWQFNPIKLISSYRKLVFSHCPNLSYLSDLYAYETQEIEGKHKCSNKCILQLNDVAHL